MGTEKRVFYSFHYEGDCERASQVRNMGVVEGRRLVSPNAWEAIKQGGHAAIKKWIDEQLEGCCCTVVLIGQETADSEWVRYEIEKSWTDGKGVLGIYIHRLKNLRGEYADKGKNPFCNIMAPGVVFERSLAKIVKVHVPPHHDSKRVYHYIRDNMSQWIDDAIYIRTAGPIAAAIRDYGRKVDATVRAFLK